MCWRLAEGTVGKATSSHLYLQWNRFNENWESFLTLTRIPLFQRTILSKHSKLKWRLLLVSISNKYHHDKWAQKVSSWQMSTKKLGKIFSKTFVEIGFQVKGRWLRSEQNLKRGDDFLSREFALGENGNHLLLEVGSQLADSGQDHEVWQKLWPVSRVVQDPWSNGGPDFVKPRTWI